LTTILEDWEGFKRDCLPTANASVQQMCKLTFCAGAIHVTRDLLRCKDTMNHEELRARLDVIVCELIECMAHGRMKSRSPGE